MDAPVSGVSRAALVVLSCLAAFSPWAFGAVHPRATTAIAFLATATSVAAATVLWRGRVGFPVSIPAGMLLLPMWLMVALQVIPVPSRLHALLAPGSHAVWYPSAPAAAAVLGAGPHPISLAPDATARALALATGLVVLSVLTAPALRNRTAALRAAIAISASGVAVALYGLAARVLFGNRLYGVFAVPTVAPFGPFVSKNHFAGYVEMAACLTLGLAVGLADEARQGSDRLSWLESRRAGWIVVAFAGAAISLLAVPVSLSRGGILSLFAGVLAFVFLRARTARSEPLGRRVWIACLGLGVIVAALLAASPSDTHDRLRTLTRTSAGGPDAYRTSVWLDTLRLVTSNPLLGSGLAAFDQAIPRVKTAAGHLRVEHAENDYLELAAETGVVGVLLFSLLCGVCARSALRRLTEDRSRLHRGLRTGALAGIAAIAAHSGFDFNLRIPSNAILFCLLAAFALAPHRPARACADAPKETGGKGVPHRPLASLLLVGMMLLATPALLFPVPRFDASALQRVFSTSGLRREALDRSATAHLRVRPADATTWVALAWLRAGHAPSEARALAEWGMRLDPQHRNLADAARRIGGRSPVPGTQALEPVQIQPRRP